MKGLRRHILDFEIISTGNPKTLVFLDSSDYMSEPERPLLEITLPGYNKYFLVNVAARKVNTFNSNTIGLTEVLNDDCLVNLPDGAYKFRFKICPYTQAYIDKAFMRTTLLEERLADVYEKLDIACDNDNNDVKKQVVEIHSLIEGAKLIVNRDIHKANEFYQLASKLVEKLLCKLDKNCK